MTLLFARKDILYRIDRKPERLQTVVQSYSSKAYRYVRYIGPRDAHCNIAEVAFYGSGDTVPLKGKVIGTPGCFQKDGSHEYTNTFDGDVTTSYDYIEPSGGWAGLDLGLRSRSERLFILPAAMIIIFVRAMNMNYSIVQSGINGNLLEGKFPEQIHCHIKMFLLIRYYC